ncbi:hypothetical protein E2C01_010251 [Portunus trituberculatus]|uniref:Uncharacterized protein n=1 Tax=Portunus trituberculatus TaxID=210409 RepID=A0A5B7D867_PORTR|nr:hypothetical protein [Portunus trituberculatus]
MSHKLRARRAPRRTEGRGVGLTQPRSKSEVSGMFHPTQNYPLARNQPSTTSTVVAAAAATVTTSNTASGALTGCSAPLATTNLRADGDTNSNPYPAGGLPSSVPHSAGRVPHSHSSSAGGALHPPSQSLRRQSLPSPSHVPTNICIPSSLPPTSLHSAQESSKSTISSSCGSIASSSFPSTSGATMTYSPNSSSFSSPTTRQVASSLHPSSPTTANPLKPFFKQSRGRRRATIDVASSLSSLTSFPSFATPPSLTTASSSSSSSSTPFFPPLGLNSYSTSYLASYKRGGLGGTATPPLLSHSLSSSTLGLAMHAPLPSRPLPRASTPPARPGEVSRRQLISDLEETKREEKLKDIADSLTRPRGSALSYVSSKPGAGDVKPTRESDAAEELDPTSNSANSQSLDTTAPSHPDHVHI